MKLVLIEHVDVIISQMGATYKLVINNQYMASLHSKCVRDPGKSRQEVERDKMIKRKGNGLEKQITE